MNPNSHYRDFAGKHKKEISSKKNVMDINPAIVTNVLPTHIKLNSPPIKLSQQCNNYTYNIDDTEWGPYLNQINDDMAVAIEDTFKRYAIEIAICIIRIRCNNSGGIWPAG